ncbi:cytochrome P450 monooxygenase-like protein [Dothidotthia symphoricarpi CBS 119687]|uniref:Cytochrome P450 monooxygenase-like protein n=1 Tax=Dothidotthia symphoricarpi CBS 119687 TaxID=1392245 RepID=A0A6A6AJP8_9PLEO|nr:cytochrome P450 monooxygenase-like protein [Dothidotthia symphoricarpi CBS 119687]KAF2131134.1 cytochrome P450 monooxygenase-like protein [Dothidotthia symphoricarpi CBS 119687]
MESQTLTGLSHVVQSAAVAALVMIIYALLPTISYRSQLAKLPSFGGSVGDEKHRQAFLKDAKAMYIEGYKKFKDSAYRLATSDGEDNVVVPYHLLPELRKLPDDVLSFHVAIDSTIESKYTGLKSDTPLVVHTVKADLTPALARLNAIVATQVDATVEEYMPPCDDWSEVYIYKTLVDVVAKVTGRVFVGEELGKDPEYLDSAINYTMDVMNATDAIKKIRPLLRPVLAPRIKEVRRLDERRKSAEAYLRPIIEERQNAAKNDPNWQQPDDVLQWMINRSTSFNKASPAELAQSQLGLAFAAIHTTTLTATNILYTLAVTPEYIPGLREEICEVMANNDGNITSRALQQMEKLDSYMKEAIRFFNPSATSFGRRVLKGITLSNGQYLPPGVTIEAPSHAVYADSQNYPESEKFDGLRHYKLRHSGTVIDNARNQFVTTNETNLGWGYGRHACPGRFFAANEIKMILARLILNYDFKMPDEQTERYPQIEIGKTSMPNPAKTLLFRKV